MVSEISPEHELLQAQVYVDVPDPPLVPDRFLDIVPQSFDGVYVAGVIKHVNKPISMIHGGVDVAQVGQSVVCRP